MDIQVASNFERLLFELKGRSGSTVADAVAAFRRTGVLPPDEQAWRRAQRLFVGHRVDDAMTLDAIADTYRRTGISVDPHTAIGIAAARMELQQAAAASHVGATPIVALATAHPAKFPEAVERATGVRPPLPTALAEIMERRERMTVLPNDIAAVARYVRAHARRSRPKRGAA